MMKKKNICITWAQIRSLIFSFRPAVKKVQFVINENILVIQEIAAKELYLCMMIMKENILYILKIKCEFLSEEEIVQEVGLYLACSWPGFNSWLPIWPPKLNSSDTEELREELRVNPENQWALPQNKTKKNHPLK